jgi:hypothetical protein
MKKPFLPLSEMRSRNLASLSRWLRSVSSMLLSSSFRPSSCCFTARTSGSSDSIPGPDSDSKQLSTDTGLLHLSSTQDSGRAEPVACMVVARWSNNVLNVLKGALTIATGGSLKHVASLEPAINTTATNQTVKRSMSEHDTPRFRLSLRLNRHDMLTSSLKPLLCATNPI